MKKFLVGFLILFLCLDGLSYASRRKRKGLITPPSKPIEEQSKIGVSVQDFEFNTKNLKKGCKEGVSFSLSKVEGKQNEALKIKYDLGKPPAWCEVCAPLSVIPETGGIYTFYIRGDSGNNVLEFKLVDEDDTTFLSKVPLNDISPEKWTEKVVEYDSLHYGWGGKNKKLDGKVKLGLAISTGHGGKGYVEIDELYYKHVSILAELQLSQIGYRPEDKKAVVLRVKGKVDKKKCPKSVKFSVVDDSSGKIGFTRIMNLVDFSDWEGIYYKGDFSSLRKSGKYRIEASFKYGRDRMKLVSYPFIIDKNAFSKSLAWSQWHFLKHLRCGERCHLKDPVPGGYHDTLDDIGKRMWSHNHLVNGIANYARLSPVQQSVIEIDGTPDSIGALKWGTRYCIDITGGDGSVPWSGVSHRMKWEDYCSKILPIIDLAEDHYPRYRNNDKSNAATAFNVVALLNAAKALEKYDKELADEAIRTAKKNWGYINRKGFGTSFDMGCYIYASLELYKFTGDKKYVGKVSKNAKKMLKLQYNDYNNVEDNICGDFYFSNREKDFHFQYKMINFNIGIYMALVELCNYLGVDDLMWWDVYYAAKVFTENYLLPMASKTPYGQMAHALEKENDGKWHVYYFAGDCDSARKAAAQTHGLNCDHFGYGLIAMKWGQHTNDLRFEEYADNQF
ncbi:MAG: cellulase N-terminal Ig-like domain-containing protein, partial [Candidatus Auribacterota bacterium]|nr:cellulase N-terminal Ig-like domain-containing protein [Candidatus Auribacterota bacterium]